MSAPFSSLPVSPAPVCAPPRYDIYVGIHKGLRALMLDILQAVGRMDVYDAAETQAVCARVLELADVCTSHLAHENDFVHPALEACQPGSSEQIAGEHEEHLAAIAGLRDAVATLHTASPGYAKERSAFQLYHRLALFLAENLSHMHHEETHHNQVLWQGYSDEELRALEGRIVASLTQEQNLFCLRWIVPAMTPGERAALLQGLQAGAPAAVVQAVLATVQPHLHLAEQDKLAQAMVSAANAERLAA